MSDDIRTIGSHRSRRGVSWLALVLLLAACTGPSDVPGTADTTDEQQAPASGDTPDQAWWDVPPDLYLHNVYRVDPATSEIELILSAGQDLHEPEASPDGSKLAYQGIAPDGTPQIFVLEDGTARQLTHLARGAWEPTWSPDGEQIAFVARSRADEDDAADTDIFVVDAAGIRVRRLAGTPADDRRPDWSPDGSQIVFDTYERQGWRGSSEIWVASVRDGELTRLDPVSLPGGLAADATWSPDGRRIALTRYANETINDTPLFTDVVVMRSDGTGAHALPPAKRQEYPHELDPSWSPDGNSITFTALSLPTRTRIGTVDLRTGAIEYLSMPKFATDLSWSAEGILVSMGNPALPSPPIQTGVDQDVTLGTGGPSTDPEEPANWELAFPAEGAEPSRPEAGELVMRFYAQNLPGCGWCSISVYADGRVVSSDDGPPEIFEGGGIAGYLEQRLTPRGVGLLREEILSFPGLRPGPGHGSSYRFFTLHLYDGDGVGTVSWDGSGGAYPAFGDDAEMRDFYARMSDLGSWLPTSAWAHARIRPYVPSHYLVYGYPLVHPLALPPPANASLRSRRCQLLSADEARAIVAGFVAAGLAPAGTTSDPALMEYAYERNRGMGYLSLEPAMPHQATC